MSHLKRLAGWAAPFAALALLVAPALAQSRYPVEVTIRNVTYRGVFTERNPSLFTCSQQQYNVVGRKSPELVTQYAVINRQEWEASGAAASGEPVPDLQFYFQCFPDGTIQIGPLNEADTWIATIGFRPQWGVIEPAR